MLFSEPKIPQPEAPAFAIAAAAVSVLFSEPKIPQIGALEISTTRVVSVSVLFSEPKIPQRELAQRPGEDDEFQCSSASRKFLNEFDAVLLPVVARFSALQRAENSSTDVGMSSRRAAARFQCSSASRKFLNRSIPAAASARPRFSALQRAENSSSCCSRRRQASAAVSVLFSEPKIPQSRRTRRQSG